MTSPKMSPWHPTINLTDLAVLGKLGEELGECSAAVGRCIVQGITGSEPVTHEPNRIMLEKEMADVLACVEHTIRRFNLNRAAILARRTVKIDQHAEWHDIIRTNVDNGVWPLHQTFRP